MRRAGRLLLLACLLTAPAAAQDGRDALEEDAGAAGEIALPAPPPGPSADATVPAPVAPAVASRQATSITIERTETGAVSLEGIAPSPADEARMLAEARTLAGSGEVTARLKIQPGAPAPGWLRMADEAFAALSRLVSGKAVIGPGGAEIDGLAEDPIAREAALETLDSAEWQARIGIQLELAEPYTFSAEKDGDHVSYAGNARDQATAASLRTMLGDVAGTAAEGALTLARGMPGEDWPQLVRAGLVALMKADSGRLLVEDREVSLKAEVPDAGAHRRLAALLGTGWQVDLTIRDPSPEPELELTVDGDRLSARGRLPAELGVESLTDMLGPIDVSAGLTADAYGQPRTWRDAINALAIAVPRMQDGKIEMTDRKARFEGALKEGFSANDLRGALRATLGPDWEVAVEIGEAPPPSQLAIVRTPEGLDIEGILPDGVEPDEVLGNLGETNTSNLSSGGDGDRWTWRRQLRRAARALRVFETGGARIDGRTIALSGTLQPGYTAGEVADWLGAQLDKGWDVTVKAVDRPGREGDRRTGLDSGQEEFLRRGRWLPIYDFEATPERCDAMLAEAGAGERITFVPGASDITPGQERLLDRLAGVARRCVEETDLSLEVQGHTDDRGEAEENLLLSEARAIEVVLKLFDRGVPAGRLEPVGYGETRPIADNETEAGRSKNRRISFTWRG